MVYERGKVKVIIVMAVISSYTFNASEKLQTHSHKHGHIIIVVENSFYIAFGGKEFELTTDMVCFVPPNTEHTYSCSGRALTLNIPSPMVKEADLAFLFDNPVLKIDDKLSLLVELIKQETAESEGEHDSLRYLFYYLYDKFVSLHQLDSIRYMKQNYAENISIATLAEIENYNVSYYSDWFRRKTGYTPSEFLKRIRMDKAREILASTRYRIIDVAMQVGYSDGSAFTRAFKEVTGMTPNRYRNESFEERKKEEFS